jgi:methylenetetrahydrofolate--tRNA-(uracil-5-)-methyltransferase
MPEKSIAIIGAGLAGSEAALVLARSGVKVELIEMRPVRMTPAHCSDRPAELVCSNSFKSRMLPCAHALLKEELALLDSPLLDAAKRTCVPAGSALAVDRARFSDDVLGRLERSGGVTLVRGECDAPPGNARCCIIAAGPLVSEALSRWLSSAVAPGALHFYDAIAPIVAAGSIDMTIAFAGSRWDKGGDDYINCPFTEEEYARFYGELRAADTAVAREFEDKRFFEGCLPVEVIASRGRDALRFGTMKPSGLRDPRTGRWPYALCQLRRENAEGTCYNLVGFQTRLRIPEQKRVFGMIPGLGRAEFLRWGSVHRNTYLDSPRVLNRDLSFKRDWTLFCAGQLCGNEGYMESVATGHAAALFARAALEGRALEPPPPTTAIGALLRHITSSEEELFCPSSIHFGLFTPPGERVRGKRRRQEFYCSRALRDFKNWMKLYSII